MQNILERAAFVALLAATLFCGLVPSRAEASRPPQMQTAALIQEVQYYPPPGYYGPRFYRPRYYGRPFFGPRYYAGPRFYGRPRYYGRRWYYRRPY